MQRIKISLLLAAVMALTGCAVISTPVPTAAVPSPQPLRIQADALFEPLSGLMASCAPAGTALYYTNGQEQADARLGWAALPSPAAYTYTLGEEKLVLVVNPQNKLQTLSAEQVREIYTGKLQKWQPVGGPDSRVIAWGYPAQDGIAQIFQEAFGLETIPLTNIQTAAGPEAVRSRVAKDPGAIGFLPQWWLDASVKALSLGNMEADIFSRPVLAGTSAEPQGALKAWLLCLQDGLKTH